MFGHQTFIDLQNTPVTFEHLGASNPDRGLEGSICPSVGKKTKSKAREVLKIPGSSTLRRIVLFKFIFTACEAKQPLQGTVLQEKEEQKDEKHI